MDLTQLEMFNAVALTGIAPLLARRLGHGPAILAGHLADEAAQLPSDLRQSPRAEDQQPEDDEQQKLFAADVEHIVASVATGRAAVKLQTPVEEARKSPLFKHLMQK